MTNRTARTAILLAGALALTLVAGACSSGGDDDGATETDAEAGDLAPGSAAINIVDLTFEPTQVTVAPGQTEVALTNADTTDHTFTLDDGSVDEEIAAGESTTVAVDIDETTGFHCEIHPSMTGTLQVA
jgi:plastocyanin